MEEEGVLLAHSIKLLAVHKEAWCFSIWIDEGISVSPCISFQIRSCQISRSIWGELASMKTPFKCSRMLSEISRFWTKIFGPWGKSNCNKKLWPYLAPVFNFTGFIMFWNVFPDLNVFRHETQFQLYALSPLGIILHAQFKTLNLHQQYSPWLEVLKALKEIVLL